jgi:hypothetical protein
LPSPQLTGQAPQSPGQIWQLSLASHCLLPHEAGHFPQSCSQLWQLSPPEQSLSPQLPPLGQVPPSVAEAQLPPQQTCAGPQAGRLPQAQAPLAQRSPRAPQALSHTPQCATLLAVSTHAPLQQVVSAAQLDAAPQATTHWSPTHRAPAGQDLPPQVPLPSTQRPWTQVRPCAQVTPAQGSLVVEPGQPARASSSSARARGPLFIAGPLTLL